ncbi:Ankyrin repeat [Sesbania bispinosa]|nr:Ankyrin repeat [Sesbania bispinosa]
MASNINTSNDDKLKIAAQSGDINHLYTLIQDEPQVAHLLDMAETPLHVAAYLGHVHFATEIMRLKPSFGWKLNHQGFSPIHVAMQKGQKSMVLRFVDINKDLVRVKGREGLTPLHLASQIGEVDLLANFLTACPESIEDVTVRGETALHIAVKNQQYEALEVLVRWLKKTHHRSAMQIEQTILNWKDEEGNTILHISALMNDSQALLLLINTDIDLNTKNLKNSTALDIAQHKLENSTALNVAGNAKIRTLLVRGGAKRGSSVRDAPTLADTLRSKITAMSKLIIFVLRMRSEISKEQQNAFVIVAALVITATFPSALSLYQAKTNDFITLSIFNMVSLLASITIIHILTPSGRVGDLLFTPVLAFAYYSLYSMVVISPTSTFSSIMLSSFISLYTSVYWTFTKVYKRLQGHAKSREIQTRNDTTGGNRW